MFLLFVITTILYSNTYAKLAIFLIFFIMSNISYLQIRLIWPDKWLDTILPKIVKVVTIFDPKTYAYFCQKKFNVRLMSG